MKILRIIMKVYKHSTDNCGGWICGLPATQCRCYK